MRTVLLKDAEVMQRVASGHARRSDVARLERLIDRLEQELPPLTRFILPGGAATGASAAGAAARAARSSSALAR